MANIPATSPSTNVTFYKGVRFNKTYNNVFWYPAQSAQDNYFASLTSKSYNSIVYQNMTDNTIRVGLPFKDLQGYNYFTFINNSANYERKKFYCFIDSMTSVNNNNTEIKYTVDVFNTFAFDYTVNQCYVLRQHAASDELYEHLEPEPITDGVYVANKDWLIDDAGNDLDCSIMGGILIVNEDYTRIDGQGNFAPAPIREYNIGVGNRKIYASAIVLACYPGESVVTSGLGLAVKSFIDAGRSDAILGCYYCPGWIVNILNPTSSGTYAGWVLGNLYATRDLAFNYSTTQLDGYTPHNKKLYSYPYRYFGLYNSDGNVEPLRYELSSYSGSIKCRQYANIISSEGVTILTVPVGYERRNVDWSHNVQWSYNEQVLLNKDNLAEWWRANKTAVAVGALSAMFSAAGAGVSAPNPLSATAGAAVQANNFATSLSSQIGMAQDAVTKSFGNFNTSAARTAAHIGTFGVDMCYRKEDLKRIDSYFDRYGYAVNRLTLPSKHNRYLFTYVHTADSDVSSNGSSYLTQDYIDQINAAYNRGVTFWNSIASGAYTEIGNFSSANVTANVPLPRGGQ